MARRESSAERVAAYHERRVSSGESSRKFYIRDEHVEILRRFQIESGLPNQHDALQALLEQFRAERYTGGRRRSAPRNDNPTTKDCP